MLKRSFVLILSLLLVLVLISCETKSDGGLLKIVEAKGIPEVSADSEKDGSTGGDEKSEAEGKEDASVNTADGDIILNTSSKKIHLSSECGYAASIKEKNKLVKSGEQLGEYLESGYTICSNCNKKYANGEQ